MDHDRGLGVATSLLVLGRLLGEPPSERTAGMFSSPQFLSSWPVEGPGRDALANSHWPGLPDATEEFAALLGPGGRIDLLESSRVDDPSLETLWSGLQTEAPPHDVNPGTNAAPDHLARQIEWLAESTIGCITVATADVGPLPAGSSETRMAGVRDRHVIPLAHTVARELAELARCSPYTVLPGLLIDTLAAHVSLFPGSPSQPPN